MLYIILAITNLVNPNLVMRREKLINKKVNNKSNLLLTLY